MSYSQTHFQVMFSHVSQKMQTATLCGWTGALTIGKCAKNLQTANAILPQFLSKVTPVLKTDVFLIHVIVLIYS